MNTVLSNQKIIEEQNKAIVQRYVDLFNKGDFSMADEIISNDYTMYINGEARAEKGVAHVKKVNKTWVDAISNGRLVIDEMVVEGNTVAIRWWEEGLHNKGEYLGIQPQNRNYKYFGMSFYKIKDGKIFEAYVVVDIYTLFSQLGALPGQH